MMKFILFVFVVSLSQVAFAKGLKKVDYNNKTTESQQPAILGGEASAGGATLSDEDAKKVLEQINMIKANQEASQKMLDQLEKEE